MDFAPFSNNKQHPPLLRVSTEGDNDDNDIKIEHEHQYSNPPHSHQKPNKKLTPIEKSSSSSAAMASDSLSRSASLRSPRRAKDHTVDHLRSTAILRSASGTRMNPNVGGGTGTGIGGLSADDSELPVTSSGVGGGLNAVVDDRTNSNSAHHTMPGVPVASLAVRRDDFHLNQGKSRSMVCLLAAAASAAEIAGQPVLVSHARTRSYLCGSVGPTSLLGVEELDKYFPDRNVRIFVGSWNMNGQTPPSFLADFLLPVNVEYVPDVLVLGTQESLPDKTDWEVRLQETLGPSHVLFHSATLGTLHLSVFLRRDLIWFCSIPETDSLNTRPGAQFKTKGAVALCFILFGTSFLFVNSHLTAHEENVKDRVRDLKKINAVMNLPKTLPYRKSKKFQLTGSGDFTDNFDCVFWCGDLNFRLEQSREVVMREVDGGSSVLDFDQLNYLKSEGLIFRGYSEDAIKFPPTYKYDPGTNQFDTSSKQRVPSYTDRILYKHQKTTEVKSLHYNSVQEVVTSDHKPVWGMWEVKIRPGKDNVPLSGGLFNREVYLEGLKKRSEALHPPSGGKMDCNLQ